MPIANPSQQQQAVFAWFKGAVPASQTAAPKNLVVRARAGTGKTTTIIEAITFAPEQSILLCAFNKKIADELSARLTNPYAEAKTLHGVGFALVRRYWSQVRVDGERGYRLARAAAGGAAAPDDMVGLIGKLASKGKGMLPTNSAALAEIAYDFDLVPDDEWARDGWDVARVAECAWKAMQLAAERDGTIDFDDMVYLPVVNRWARPQYDLVVVDEAQDMNAAQLKLAMGVAAGRIAVVGDDRQAIYAFRGADSGALDRLKTALGALELGLTQTYRCGQTIVALARELVPDFTAAPANMPGTVIGTRASPLIAFETLGELVKPGDFVLSRKNAPLAKACLAILRKGKRAKVEGRDVGAGIKALVRKVGGKSIPDFAKRLTAWELKAVKRARAMAKTPERAEAKAEEIADQAETLRALAEGTTGIKELFARIDDLFADDVNGALVVCSSVHRAKGREADRVFVLAETLYPGGRKGIEEQNIEYVAITRAKQQLTWIKGGV